MEIKIRNFELPFILRDRSNNAMLHIQSIKAIFMLSYDVISVSSSSCEWKNFHYDLSFPSNFCNRITFRPGDRVTVWQEKFYCPHCINQVCCSATVGSVPSKNLLQTPLSVTDDEGCVSASDMASSQYIHEQLIEMNQPQNDFSCISSAGLPQKSRSILRKPVIEQNGLHASKEKGYLSKSLHYRVLILIRRHRFWSRRAFMRSKP